jgi:hypothetical protein
MSPLFSRLALPLLSCLALLPLNAAAAPAAAPVTVTRVTWHGWPEALRLSNGVVEAIVVPTIGRIMAFEFVGHPETNPIFTNPEWAGKTVADAVPTTWATFGGDKLWPAPQGDWPKHNVRAWPPDPAFDGDPEIAQILPDGVRLVTPNSTAFAAHATRTITLKPGEARLYIAQTLVKDADAANPETLPPGLTEEQAGRLRRDGFPLGIWSITQTRGDETVFLPLSSSGRFPLGYAPMGDPGTVEPAALFTAQGGALRIGRDTHGTHKVGTDSGAGWTASLYSGTVLFSEHEPYQVGAVYPDGGLPLETYTNDNPAYIEMELLGPMTPLTHGQKILHAIYWQLQRLPHVPKSAADAAALVTAAMR